MKRRLGRTGWQVGPLTLDLTAGPAPVPEEVDLVVVPPGQADLPRVKQAVALGRERSEIEAALGQVGRVDLGLLYLPSLQQLLHGDGLPYLRELCQSGRVDNLGVWCAGAADCDLAVQLEGVDVVFVEFHPFALDAEREALHHARSRDVGVVARCDTPLLGRGPREVTAAREERAARLLAAFPEYRGHLSWLLAAFSLSGPAVTSLLTTPADYDDLQHGLALPRLDPEAYRRVRRVALGLEETPQEGRN